MPSSASQYDVRPTAGHERHYKRPSHIPARVADWEKWRAKLTAKDEDKLNGRGKLGQNAAASVNLLGLQYRPLNAQYRFHASNSKHKGYSGPVGSGKSLALAYESLYLSALSPNCIGYVTAPTRTMLHGAAQRAIFQMLQEEGIRYSYKGGEQDTITFMPGDPNFDATNGRLTPSQIVFRTASNPDRLRGPNIAWFGMDEMTYSDQESWDILIGRIRDPRANQYNGFGCWTPKGYDWVYDKFINPLTRDHETEMIYSTPGENFHLPENFYAGLLRTYDTAWADQEVKGSYLSVFQGQVYHGYDPKESVQQVNYVPGLPLVWTFDFNVNPFCTVLLQLVDGPHQRAAGMPLIRPWSEIWAIDELVLNKGNTYEMCEALKKKVQPWVDRTKNRMQIHLYGDATGARKQTSAFSSDWEIIQQWFVENNHIFDVEWYVNVPGRLQNPPIRARVNAVNAALKSADGIRRLKIDPKCKVLLKDLQSVSWRKGDNGTNMDEGKDRALTHASDALGYYVVYESINTDALEYMRRRLDGF